jgi:hypothetical protein
VTSSTRLVSWLLLAGLSVSIVGCGQVSGSNDPHIQLVSPINGAFGIGLQPNKSKPVSVGSISVCTQPSGRVTIDKVEPVSPVGQLTVEAFAVRHNWGKSGNLLGGKWIPLARIGDFGRLSHDVTTSCSAPMAAELGLQVSAPPGKTAWANSFELSYHDAFGSGTTQAMFGICIPAKEGSASKDCKDGPNH